MTDSSVRTSRTRHASIAILCVAVPAVLLMVSGCPSGNGKTGGKAVAGACDSVSERVASLYKAEQAATKGSDKLDKETRQELVAANTHMVLKDCETDPKQFLPCIERASSAAQLESECIVALDDAGKVEEQQFRK